jgi:hypothetical protein
MTKWILAAVIITGALMAGCASLPPPDQAKCLLAIAVKNEGQTSTEQLAYAFWIRGSDQKLTVAPQNGVEVFVLAPGTYTIDRYSIVPGALRDRYMGSLEPYPFGPISFKLVEGSITILPYTLVNSEVHEGTTIYQRRRWDATKRDEVIAQLAKRDNFSRWRVAE